ncbi:hypothetical protein LTR95_017315 [Oleoguttula sp. CCFEE 5521]
MAELSYRDDLEKELLRTWGEIVEDYTRRDTTRSEDKLRAIAGVAKAFQRTTGDVYVWGLWKRNLAIELLWHVEWEPQARPLEYRAPSWSWAAVKTIGESVLTTNGPNPLEVEPRFAVLEMPTGTAKLSVGSSEARPGLVVRARLCIAFWDPFECKLYEGAKEPAGPESPAQLRERGKSRDMRDIGYAYPDALEDESSSPGHVICMLVAKRNRAGSTPWFLGSRRRPALQSSQLAPSPAREDNAQPAP